MQKASTRFAEFDLIRALAIVSVVIIHAGFFAFGQDRSILLISIDTLQLFCVPAFLVLSGFFLANKLDNQNNPTLILKKRLSRIIPPYLFWSVVFYILNNLSNLKQFDLLGLVRDVLTGSVMPPYYFIVAIVQCYLWWWILVKLRFLEPIKILALGFIIQIAFTTVFYLAALKYLPSIPIPLMERWIFSWILPFSTGLVLGSYYDNIQKYLQRHKMPVLAATILFYLASIWEYYLLSEVNSDAWFARSFFKLSTQGYAILFVLSILAFSQSIRLPSKVSGLIKILAAYSFPIYLLDLMVVRSVFSVSYTIVSPAEPLLKLVFLVTVDLLVCFGIIYLLHRLLPKNYSQYILGI